MLPAAHYESAILLWVEACDPALYPADPEAVEAYRREKVGECYTILKKVAAWEAYVLDVRIGMRVGIADDTVEWLRKKKGWS